MAVVLPENQLVPPVEIGERKLVVGGQYLVHRQGVPSRKATVLGLRKGKTGLSEAYITFEGADKRLDSWVPESQVGLEVPPTEARPKATDEAAESTVPLKKQVREIEELVRDGELSKRAEPSPSAPSTPEREHAAMTRVRNFEDVRFGEYLIKTWYFSPYPLPPEDKPEPSGKFFEGNPAKKRRLDSSSDSAPEKHDPNHHHKSSHRSVGELLVAGVGRKGEGARGRLWVCDLCFKYMHARDSWERHTSRCEMMKPPGRKVYQRGSYTIWEIDGAQAPLYCQNLSLFGKLFIDHKSVFFHVENFLFYAICDASTSRRDQVMAFFSKEKLSYDDYNLACIVTFPPCQNRGFGKLLIEFSYYLTKHPATRGPSMSPGTPERPLSDLGLKGYTAYWVSTLLRVCKQLLASAPPLPDSHLPPIKPGSRPLRTRRAGLDESERIVVNDVEMRRIKEPNRAGQYAVSLNLSDLARAAHLRIDDTAFTMAELGFLQQRRPTTSTTQPQSNEEDVDLDGNADEDEGDNADLGEWKHVELVISRQMVDDAWASWRVRDKGVLDEQYVLLQKHEKGGDICCI